MTRGKGAKDTRKRTSRKHFQKRRKSRLNGKANQHTELDPSVTTGRIRPRDELTTRRRWPGGPTSGAAGCNIPDVTDTKIGSCHHKHGIAYLLSTS